MPSNRETDRRAGYPKLTDAQIDLIIDTLVWSVRQRDLGNQIDLVEDTIAHLVGFYTRRWGLPPAITGRVNHIRERAAELESRLPG